MLILYTYLRPCGAWNILSLILSTSGGWGTSVSVAFKNQQHVEDYSICSNGGTHSGEYRSQIWILPQSRQGKSWLVVKEQVVPLAKQLFGDLDINITTRGQKYLGAALGGEQFVADCINKKIKSWVTEVESMASIAKYQLQAAYAAFIHGITSRWSFLFRTITMMKDHVQPLEEAIRYKLLPAMTGKTAMSDNERNLLSLPTKLTEG